MNVLLIEDEAPAARRLSQLIKEVEPEANILEIIDSVEAAVHWIKNNKTPDIIFMDIQLADGLSFSILEQVAIQSPVIFTTAYDEYALRAFAFNSIDYLLKPIDKPELERSLQKHKKNESLLRECATPAGINGTGSDD